MLLYKNKDIFSINNPQPETSRKTGESGYVPQMIQAPSVFLCTFQFIQVWSQRMEKILFEQRRRTPKEDQNDKQSIVEHPNDQLDNCISLFMNVVMVTYKYNVISSSRSFVIFPPLEKVKPTSFFSFNGESSVSKVTFLCRSTPGILIGGTPRGCSWTRGQGRGCCHSSHCCWLWICLLGCCGDWVLAKRSSNIAIKNDWAIRRDTLISIANDPTSFILTHYSSLALLAFIDWSDLFSHFDIWW